MNRIDRLLGIVTMLQSRKYVPAEKIAEKYDISIRTVYRDIKALCEQGIPVSFEPFRGYFIVQGYFLPPVSFSSEEANALLLMETLISSFADKSIEKYYASALNKIKSVLRSNQKEHIELLHKNIKLQVPVCFRNDYEHLSLIQKCIIEKSIIDLDYKNSKEEISNRKVEPAGLIFYAFSWHLIGWCHLRGDYRDFKVSRIIKLRSTGTPFQRESHIDIGDYMKMLPVDY